MGKKGYPNGLLKLYRKTAKFRTIIFFRRNIRTIRRFIMFRSCLIALVMLFVIGCSFSYAQSPYHCQSRHSQTPYYTYTNVSHYSPYGISVNILPWHTHRVHNMHQNRLHHRILRNHHFQFVRIRRNFHSHARRLFYSHNRQGYRIIKNSNNHFRRTLRSHYSR